MYLSTGGWVPISVKYLQDGKYTAAKMNELEVTWTNTDNLNTHSLTNAKTVTCDKIFFI